MMRRLGAVAALAATLCAGCAGGSGPGADRRLPAATVESFRLLMYQPRDLALAEHRLTQRCMLAHGFEYPARVPDPAADTGSLLRIPPPFTVEKARADGYGSTIRREPPTAPAGGGTAVDRYVAALSPADQARYRLALDDENAGKVTVSLPGGAKVTAASHGCRGEARLRTYGSLENYLTIVYLPQMAQTEVGKLESDRALVATMKRYAGCMADGGYPVATPAAAAQLAETYYAGGPSPAARDREVALAVRDATCQRRTRVHPVYREAVDRLAAAWITDHEAAVLAAAEAQRAALVRARAVLRAG
jgi:hypothetical protein